MKIKLLVTDLDKTLLNDQNRIGEYSISILKQARESGFRICFASGRQEQMMSLYHKMTGGVDYLLSANGALVRETSTGRILNQDDLPASSLECLLRFLQENNFSFILYSTECAYYKETGVNVTRRMEAYENLAAEIGFTENMPRKELDWFDLTDSTQNIVKAVVYENNESRMKDVRAFIDGQEELCMESTGENLLGIFKKEVSKKKALEIIMNELRIGKENVAVFGDYENDLSMFECAGTRVAVENAVAELKAQADYITANNNEEGVAHFIDLMILNKNGEEKEERGVQKK